MNITSKHKVVYMSLFPSYCVLAFTEIQQLLLVTETRGTILDVQEYITSVFYKRI